MTTFSLAKDHRLTIDGVEYVIGQQDVAGKLMLVSENGLIDIKARDELVELYLAGRLTGSQPPGDFRVYIPDDVDLKKIPDIIGFSKADVLTAALKHKFVQFALARGPWCSTPDYLGGILAEFVLIHATGRPLKRTTLYVAYRRFVASAGNWQAQLPRHHKKGNRKKRKSQEIQQLVSKMFDVHYLNNSQKSVKNVIRKTQEHIHIHNKTCLDSEKLQMPDKSYFYRYRDSVEAFEVTQKRRGHMEAMREFPKGTKVVKSTRALERVEMDHTHGNVILIDEETGIPWGNPTITVAVDAANGCFVGIYISPGAPNFNCILGCLRSVCLPKQFDHLDIGNSEWPFFGIPRQVICDNGPDFHAGGFVPVALDLGCDIVYCGVGQAQQKPHVERAIGTLSSMLMNELPGTTFSRYEDRGSYESEKMATLTFREFVEIVIQWICTVYHQTPSEHTLNTPAERWLQTASAADIRIPHDRSMVERLLGHTTRLKLQKGPLVLDGIAYSSEYLGDLRRTYGMGTEFMVRYFEECLDHIEIIDPKTQRAVQVPSIDEEYTRGLTRHMHRLVMAYRRQRFKELRDNPTLIEARIHLEQKIENAKAHGRKLKKSHRKQMGLAGYSSDAPEGRHVPLSEQEPQGSFITSVDVEDNFPRFRVE